MDMEELLHQKIDQLEAALTAERERADGLQRQLDDEREHVRQLYEHQTPPVATVNMERGALAAKFGQALLDAFRDEAVGVVGGGW